MKWIRALEKRWFPNDSRYQRMRRRQAIVLGMIGVLAIVLGTAGFIAILSHSVGQRRVSPTPIQAQLLGAR